MPDESLIPTTPPSDTPAPSAGSPVIPDPQKLVDEALTPTSAQPPVPSSLPDPAPAADLPPLSPTDVPDTTPTSSAPMSDDMPLAFAGAPSPASASPDLAAAVASQSLPPLPSPDMPIVPPPSAPLPPLSSPSSEQPKKKGLGKVLGAVVGLFLLLGGIAGGYWYYINNFGEQATIAAIDLPQSQCSGCDPFGSGHLITWRDGKCVQKGALCNSDSPNNTGTIITIDGVCYQDKDGNTNTTNDRTGYGFFCGDCVNKCVSTAALQAAGGGCSAYIKQQCGSVTTVGVQCTDDEATALKNGWTKTCSSANTKDGNGYDGSSCGSSTVWFSSTGQCNNSTNNGLCAVYPKCKVPPVTTDPNDTDPTPGYTCDKNGCTVDVFSASCYVVRYTCKDVNGNYSNGCSDNGDAPAKSYSFNNKCAVQQIDVHCGTQNNFISRTDVSGCASSAPKPSVSPNPSPSPTLACTSLTKDKATPKKGDKVTFTCKGTTTNAGNPTLTYQFRLRKDSGEWQSLTATGDKASYTVNAAGAYEVQCKACGILKLGAASTCDPDWSAAQ